MKKYLIRVVYKEKDRQDLVLIVKAKNIVRYMNNFVADILDDIEGYEYDELRRLKRNEMDILCGAWSGADFIKAMLNKNEK